MRTGPILETERLCLRPVSVEILEPLHALWTDPDVRRYLFDDVVVPRQQVASVIAGSTASFATSGGGLWTASRHGQTSLTGFGGYHEFHQPPEMQLLYGLEPESWGRGLATEIARALIGYGFEELAMERIIASTDDANTASREVMERSGMRFEKQVKIGGLETIYYTVDRRQRSAFRDAYRLAEAV